MVCSAVTRNGIKEILDVHKEALSEKYLRMPTCGHVGERRFHISQESGLEEGAGLDGAMPICWRQESPN
jgi:hypothetical protein